MMPGKRIFLELHIEQRRLGFEQGPGPEEARFDSLTATLYHKAPTGRGWVQAKGRAMAEKKFEEALERLEEIVEQLETGELPLDQALKIFEEGMKLIKFCSGKLEEAEKKVSLLVREAGGEPAEVPFEPNGQEKGGQ